MKTILLVTLFILTSCAGFVNSVHQQIDREEKVASKSQSEKVHDRFAQYRSERRQHAEKDKRPIKDPLTYSLGGAMRPPVKREYRQPRYTKEDFKDDDSEGSLWANQGNSSSLFTYQNDKHTGDMVIINVLENLRNQISSELKRTFPDKPVRPGGEAAKGDDKKPDAQGGAAAAAAAGSEDHDLKVYDKISGTVTEEISKDYVLLRGRKDVIYKKEKRSIEVQALVSRKDILENDYVNSDRLLESQVIILRDI